MKILEHAMTHRPVKRPSEDEERPSLHSASESKLPRSTELERDFGRQHYYWLQIKTHACKYVLGSVGESWYKRASLPDFWILVESAQHLRLLDLRLSPTFWSSHHDETARDNRNNRQISKYSLSRPFPCYHSLALQAHSFRHIAPKF